MAQFTIKDLARKLGISPSTVSRALHDHPDISDETKARVTEMAREYNYQPNQIAKSLQTRRTSTIGVVVPEIRHNFFSSIISGAEEVAYEAGYTIMVCQSRESIHRERTIMDALASHRVAGVLVSVSRQTGRHEHLANLLRQGIPMVQVDRTVEDLPTHRVVVDDQEGAYGAVRHLIERGYKRIAHLAGNMNVDVSHRRRQGYLDALRDHGVSVRDEFVVDCGYLEEDGKLGMERLLRLPEPPDAVFCVNDPVAVGAFTHLREAGKRIPEDVALVGFSNNPVTALLSPPLTTVAQHAHRIGATAVEMLLRQLDDERNFKPETVVIPTRLVIRQST